MVAQLARLAPPLPDGSTLRTLAAVARAGLADRRASFELSLATLPRDVGYAVIAGIEPLCHALALRPPLTALAPAARAADVDSEIASRLQQLPCRLDLDAPRDGTVVFAGEPLVRVESTVFECIALRPLLRDVVARSVAFATHVSRLALASGADGIVDGASADAGPDRAAVLAWAASAGGAIATTNAAATAQLGIAARYPALSIEGDEAPDSAGWGRAPADAVLDLGEAAASAGASEDELGFLLELKRTGARGSFITRSLGEATVPLAAFRYELVAIEEGGAWTARKGLSGGAPILAGRKRVQRFVNAARALVRDWVHLDSERVAPAKSLGASSVTPLLHAFARGGQLLEAGDTPALARERLLQERAALPPALLRFKHPSAPPVTRSPGLEA